jgi:hypothetical protein
MAWVAAWVAVLTLAAWFMAAVLVDIALMPGRPAWPDTSAGQVLIWLFGFVVGGTVGKTTMARSLTSYQREIRKLKALILSMQWVQPTYNGSPSCSSCGQQQHLGCTSWCAAARVTGNRGGRDDGRQQ